MNWFAKINLKIVIEQLGALRSALFLLLLITACIYGGYRIGHYYHGFHVNTLDQQKLRLDSLYKEQENQIKIINTLEVELTLERIANQKAQNTLKFMEKEHYIVKKELAFYEKVMAPEKEVDGLVVDKIKITATQSPNHYTFQVILVQQELKKRYAKGYIELTFQGSKSNKPTKINLAAISSLTKKDLSFSFKYFKILEGEFTLPEDFIPEKTLLSVILPKGKWQKYYRLNKNIAWSLD